MKKNFSTGYLLDFYGPLLTDKQREALDMYYNMDYSLSEIAAEFGVTRQCVHRFILQGEKRVEEMERTLRHAALYSAAEETLKAIRMAEKGEKEAGERLSKAAETLAAHMERERDGI